MRGYEDAELGPIFNDAISDWPEHLEKLAAFWSSVMLTSGRYKGQPVPAHLKHKSRITPALFDRWLTLWAETTNEMMSPEAASALQAKAKRIAENLQLAVFFRLDRQRAEGSAINSDTLDCPSKAMPDILPYRSTPVFDQDTLPAALRARHDTKAGVWGLIRVLKASLSYLSRSASEIVLTPNQPGLVLPQRRRIS
jgi:hemoglobin